MPFTARVSAFFMGLAMRSVQATAPAKIILLGEHAVVYNRPAIAVPVNEVMAQVRLQAAPPGHGCRLIAPDLGLDSNLADLATADPLATIIRLTLSFLGQTTPPDAVLHLTSTIPLGRGLGSGAAVATAIGRALGHFFERPLRPAEISELVYEVEKLYHGTPSGIDNTVIAFNQPVYFVRGQPIQRLAVAAPLHLVIADTGLVSPTHQTVGYVREQWQAEPDRFRAYFDEIKRLVDQARHLISTAAAEPALLGQLMDQNQTILAAMGVSAPQLNQLIQAARQAGALGAKLSGAGWGGNMVALTSAEQANGVGQALRQAGATGIILTTVASNTRPV
jgi:mevalonate kinase